MKIGILLASDFTEGNGANARIKAYAKGLKEQGADVEILFLHASSFNNTLVNNKKKGYWEGIFYQFLNNRVTRPNSFWGKVFDSVRAIVGSTYYLLSHYKELDVLYLYSPKFHQFFHIYLLSQLLRITTVIEKTELDSAMYTNDQAPMSRLMKQLHVWNEKYAHQFCDHLVVISKRLYNYYRQFFSENRISLIPIIVDMERFTHLNGDPKKPYRVGYLGSFGEKDGVPGIIDAFARAHKEIPDLKLRLMGYNPYEEATREHLDYYQLNGSVEYLGQVKYSNIPDLIHECDLLIVNRTNTDYANYGFPTKLGEYLATGRPTIVTNVGDVPNYLQHEEDTYIIEPDDWEDLAAVIRNRYERYDQFNQIGEQGKVATQQLFDYRIHVKQLHKILKAIVSKSNTDSSEDDKDNTLLEPLPNKNDGVQPVNPPFATKD